MKFSFVISAIVAALTAAQNSQSPIDLPILKTVPNQANLSFLFEPAPAVIAHDNHTIKATWNAGANSHLTLNGKAYKSVQFHTHYPSEHTVSGKQYPFEVHFVHSDKDSNLAVVGVFFDVKENAEANPFMEQFLSGFSSLHKPGDNFTVASLDPSSLKLSVKNTNAYRYKGSLTTPPFTEGVEWTVLEEVQTMSTAQFDEYKHVMHETNAREVQPLNGRTVTFLAKDRAQC
ncbi:unnamed protein product [Aphanomyces euteiches]|uniref:Carbonic anhydrase n=1 Tax=Aphanomyces euteiches TaxID=100861 RepID=A0A6G0XEI0_9STRA|nr:hypothetical protein Ae201684_005706 [Aphanomyces euteiches]KAH9078623.1 hypothetical protein Ae201684P_019702 [Aphanomyces euteiches]